MKLDIRGILLIVLASLIMGFLLGAGVMQRHYANPTCHSVTEDGRITDCDYRNGGWFPKR